MVKAVYFNLHKEVTLVVIYIKMYIDNFPCSPELKNLKWMLYCFFFYRDWPKPVLLKRLEESFLNLPVWDPRVGSH